MFYAIAYLVDIEIQDVDRRNIIRKTTGGRKKCDAEVEDILHLLFEADKLKVGLPKYAAVDINRFPHIPLEEVDGSVILNKVVEGISNEIEGSLKGFKECFDLEIDSACTDCNAVIQEMADKVKNAVKVVVREWSDEFGKLDTKLQELRVSVENMVQQTMSAKRYKSHISNTSEDVPNTAEDVSTLEERGTKLGAREYADVVKSSSKSSQGSARNDKWILVDRLRRRNIKPIVGNRMDVESGLRGVEARKRDTWDIYVGNLVGVSETQLLDYLKSQSIEVKKCHLLSSKVRGTCSARLRVSIEHKEKALDPDCWPEHIGVRSWIMRPRWAAEDIDSQFQKAPKDTHGQTT